MLKKRVKRHKKTLPQYLKHSSVITHLMPIPEIRATSPQCPLASNSVAQFVAIRKWKLFECLIIISPPFCQFLLDHTMPSFTRTLYQRLYSRTSPTRVTGQQGGETGSAGRLVVVLLVKQEDLLDFDPCWIGFETPLSQDSWNAFLLLYRRGIHNDLHTHTHTHAALTQLQSYCLGRDKCLLM